MLEITNLSCGYGSGDIVKSFGMTVHEGEKLCILGPNGCGKTTLLRAISGMLAYNGSAKINGQEISSMSRRELSGKVAMFSQISSVYFGYTVYDTVAMGRYLKQKGAFSESRKDSQATLSCLERLGLLSIKDKPITELSGGQLQRTMLARTFNQEPQIILLDEPTNHLDISAQISLIKLIKEWAAEDNRRSVVGVIHEISLIPMLFERTVLMSNGEKLADGDTAKVLKSSELATAYGADVAGFMQDCYKFWKQK